MDLQTRVWGTELAAGGRVPGESSFEVWIHRIMLHLSRSRFYWNAGAARS